MIIFQYFKWDKCVTFLNTRACLKVHIPRNHDKPWYFLVYTNICLWILWFDNISKGIVKLHIFNKHWNWLKFRIKIVKFWGRSKKFKTLRLKNLLPKQLCRAATTKPRQIERSGFFSTGPQRQNSNLQTGPRFIRCFVAEKNAILRWCMMIAPPLALIRVKLHC